MNQTARFNTRNSVYLKAEAKKPRFIKSESIKLLELMADEAARKRYPTVPYLAPRTYSDKNTNELTKCVIDFLKLQNHFVERTGNEGRIIDNRKAVTDILGNSRMIGSITRVNSSGMRGTSDLKALINSQFIAIEIKCAATKDRQSEAQRTYQLEVEKAGGFYIIATSFQQFYSWYNLKFSKP